MVYICPNCDKSDKVEPFNFKHYHGEYTCFDGTQDIQHTETIEEPEQTLYLMCKRCKKYGKRTLPSHRKKGLAFFNKFCHFLYVFNNTQYRHFLWPCAVP